MALWDKISSRGNVEDRRGMGALPFTGIGLGGLALYIAANLLLGGRIDIGQVLYQLQNAQVNQQQTQDTSAYQGQDSYEVFASTVLGSNNDLWNSVFAAQNKTYTPPKLVLFRSATQSGCGVATSEVGPHYCPIDQTIYLDETFFEELQNRLGAKGGDVAQAYVISHEVGHHVQNQLGTLEKVDNEAARNAKESNVLSVRMELQADCLAGVWAHSIKDEGVLEQGEINEALDAASAVGDDRIQKKVLGRIRPETWTHGSSQQRVQWFTTGYDSGDMQKCNTFQ